MALCDSGRGMTVLLLFCVGASVGAVLARKTAFRGMHVTALLCGAAYAVMAAQFGPTAECARFCILFALLTAAALADLHTMEIPDSVPFAAVCVFFLFLPFEKDVCDALLHGLVGMLPIGGGMLLLSWCADRWTGYETLGGGDIKLFAVLGLYFGLAGGMLAIALSCGFGLLACAALRIHKNEPLPFAPFIALGAFVTAIAGEDFTRMALYAH